MASSQRGLAGTALPCHPSAAVAVGRIVGGHALRHVIERPFRMQGGPGTGYVGHKGSYGGLFTCPLNILMGHNKAVTDAALAPPGEQAGRVSAGEQCAHRLGGGRTPAPRARVREIRRPVGPVRSLVPRPRRPVPSRAAPVLVAAYLTERAQTAPDGDRPRGRGRHRRGAPRPRRRRPNRRPRRARRRRRHRPPARRAPGRRAAPGRAALARKRRPAAGPRAPAPAKRPRRRNGPRGHRARPRGRRDRRAGLLRGPAPRGDRRPPLAGRRGHRTARAAAGPRPAPRRPTPRGRARTTGCSSAGSRRPSTRCGPPPRRPPARASSGSADARSTGASRPSPNGPASKASRRTPDAAGWPRNSSAAAPRPPPSNRPAVGKAPRWWRATPAPSLSRTGPWPDTWAAGNERPTRQDAGCPVYTSPPRRWP